MRRSALGLSLLLLVTLACPAGDAQPEQPKPEPASKGDVEAPAKAEPKSEPPPSVEPPPKSECVSDCVRDNQMRAVSQEQIEADCVAGCCVSDCVQRNQMRAVSAEQIEVDCRGECGR